MLEWFKVVIRILLMQAGPQDLPASRSSLVLSIVLYWMVATTVTVTTNESRGLSLLLLSFILQLAMVFAVLQMSNRVARFNQTASALFATAALLGLINLPLWLMAEPPMPAGLALLILGGLFWSLAVDGSIWRHALDRSFGMGLSVAVLLFVIHFAIMQSIGPPAGVVE